MTTIGVITGTVAGFVLILDPDNSDGRYERLEFSDAIAMAAHADQIDRDDVARFKENPNPRFIGTAHQYYTVYQRTDNGEMEPSEGYDPTGKVKVGDLGYKTFCRECHAPMWLIGDPSTGNYRCGDCCESENDDLDFIRDDETTSRCPHIDGPKGVNDF